MLTDKPLSELWTYKGSNPKPADFDEFWNRALAEVAATDPALRLERAAAPLHPRDVELFDLWFTGVGGARIYAKYVRPKKIPAKLPTVLEFHGYSASSNDWSGKLRYPGEGVAIASMDCRGQGGRSEDLGGAKGNTLIGHLVRGLGDSPEKLYYRNVFLDTVQLARVVMSLDETDASHIASTGGSQGGGLALACAAFVPEVARCCAVFPFLSDYQRTFEMEVATYPYSEIREYMRRFNVHGETTEAIFERMGYIDVHHLAPRIKAECLVVLANMDTLVPPSTQFAVYNCIEAPKRHVLYPYHGHEGLPYVDDRTFDFLTWK